MCNKKEKPASLFFSDISISTNQLTKRNGQPYKVASETPLHHSTAQVNKEYAAQIRPCYLRGTANPYSFFLLTDLLIYEASRPATPKHRLDHADKEQGA